MIFSSVYIEIVQIPMSAWDIVDGKWFPEGMLGECGYLLWTCTGTLWSLRGNVRGIDWEC